jgi:hypothetical protein
MINKDLIFHLTVAGAMVAAGVLLLVGIGFVIWGLVT